MSFKHEVVGLEDTDNNEPRFGLVKVTSREMIKPSCPTPTENKTVRFSVIDQIVANEPISVLFFYENNLNNPINNSIEASNLLKKSLSETLVVFYPLAGRVVQNKMIECNDEGVEFCEAQISRNLLHYLENPSHKELYALVPSPLQKNIVLTVQVNMFSCGGLALSVCLSHKIADFAALFDFLNYWATNARRVNNEDNIGRSGVVVFEGASIFPGLPELEETSPVQLDEDYLRNARVELRRLVFDKKMIDELKSEAEAGGVTRPTRVELVTAFLWKHLSPCFNGILQLVNLRKKLDPTMADNFIGNCVWFTKTSSIDVSIKSPELIIEEFRKAIDKVSGHYVRALIASDNIMAKLNEEMFTLFQGVGDYLVCNSYAGCRVYDINFGWGDPKWVAPVSRAYMNGILTVTTKCGQGIEVWICMHQHDMAVFDSSLSHFPRHLFKVVDLA